MTENAERRSSPRVPLAARVDVESEGRAFLAAVGNLSLGGMLIFTANPVAEGEHLTITFVLPGPERKIRCAAIVRHVVPDSAMGVEFQNLAPEDAAAIRTFTAGK